MRSSCTTRVARASSRRHPLDARRASLRDGKLVLGLLALLGCPAAPVPAHPHARAGSAAPSTDRERRTWLLLEDRCLVEHGPPCAWSGPLADGAKALAALLAREGQEALRREADVRGALQTAGVGDPNTMAAALFYAAGPPTDQDVAAFVSGIVWPFPARAFGVAEAPAGAASVPDAATPAAGMLVVVGAEPLVDLAPLPRWLPQEASIPFQGRVLFPAESLEVLLADPAGTIRQAPLLLDDEDGFDGAVHVGPAPGRWVFELVAQDETLGPRVIYLLPLELSLQPPPAVRETTPAGPATTDPAAAEAAMAALVGSFRAANGLTPLDRDPALDRVARAHAADMAAHDFLGHVSPTRGDLDARLRAAGVAYARVAENLALAPSAEDAFANLLESPAHRENFLQPDFARFGVAAAAQGDSLVFAIELAAVRAAER